MTRLKLSSACLQKKESYDTEISVRSMVVTLSPTLG